VCSWASAVWIWWRRTKNSSSGGIEKIETLLLRTTALQVLKSCQWRLLLLLWASSLPPLPYYIRLCVPSSIDEIKTLKLSRVWSNICFAFFLILLKVFLNKSCMEDRTEKETKQNKEKSATCLCRVCIFKLLETELLNHLYDLFLFVVLG
jgi:hypothetical protein